MQMTTVTSHLFPRRFVELAVDDGERFMQAFADTRFLLVDLAMASNRLLTGLMASLSAAPFRLDDEPATECMHNTVTRLFPHAGTPVDDLEQEAQRLLEALGERASFALSLDNRVPDLMRHQVFVGRHSESHVVLKHPSVSKHHAVISQTPDGSLLIYDAGSKNGTWLNGKRMVRAAPIRPGDRLRFGDVGALVVTGTVLWTALDLDRRASLPPGRSQ